MESITLGPSLTTWQKPVKIEQKTDQVPLSVSSLKPLQETPKDSAQFPLQMQVNKPVPLLQGDNIKIEYNKDMGCMVMQETDPTTGQVVRQCPEQVIRQYKAGEGLGQVPPQAQAESSLPININL